MTMKFALLTAFYYFRRLYYRVRAWLNDQIYTAFGPADDTADEMTVVTLSRRLEDLGLHVAPPGDEPETPQRRAWPDKVKATASAATAFIPGALAALWRGVSSSAIACYRAWESHAHKKRTARILRPEPEPKPAKTRARFSAEPLLATVARKAVSPALTLLTLTSAAALIAWTYTLPPPSETYPLSATLAAPVERELVLLTAEGKPFARRGGCYGAPVSRAELPDHFVDALLSMEDRRFYSHFGIDPVGVVRAALSNYEAGRIVQGGSTITQQLAKISYLSSDKTVARKLDEAVAVLRLESNLTKDQILERYLSRAYFGESCYGLRAAARHYFKQPVSKLTIPQSAFLVALLKSPTMLASNPERLKARSDLVLDAMVENNRLDEGVLTRMKSAVRVPRKQETAGAYYADWIADTIRLPDDGGMSPLTVKTSYEPALQHAAEQAISKIIGRAGKVRRASQAALVAMRPDGRVVAMVGGADYGMSQFNRATKALRQPGSSFKSFVYLAALRAGGRPDMMVMDAPISIGNWSPENYGRNYRGVVSLRQAFSSSINTAAVRVSEAAGREQVIKAARDLGITTPLHPDPSIALGTSEVTLLQLTSAYAAFDANAYPVKPWGITATGNASSQRATPPDGTGRWRLAQGATMRELLSATVQYGTGRGARLGYPSYGKTGTSQNYRDAWFIGFAGNLVVGVWVGNDDNTPMARVTGGNLPTLIWAQFMHHAGKADPHFSTRLPQRVAGFEARPNPHSTRYADAGAFQSQLFPNSEYADSGSYYGNPNSPMTFGYGYGYRNGYGYEDRRERPDFRFRQRWRNRDARRTYRRVFGRDW